MPKNPEKFEPESVKESEEVNQEETSQNPEKEFRIEAIKSKVEEFRADRNKALTEDLLERFSPEEYYKLHANPELWHKDSKELSEYLKDNKNKFSNEATSYLHARIEWRKLQERSSNKSDNEIISLSGKEAQEFKYYNDHNKEFKRETAREEKIFDEFLDSDDPNMSEILDISMSKDYKFVEDYILKNREKLSPKTKDFLELHLKKLNIESTRKEEELKEAREKAEKVFDEKEEEKQ